MTFFSRFMPKNNTEHFGEHIMLDGYDCNYKSLNNKNLVELILKNLPSLLNMQKLSDPVVYLAPGNNKRDPGGWTGMVVIEESHISIHTFPKRGFVSIDVYTCINDLDTDFIKDYFKKQFKIKKLETNFAIRGKKYPKNDMY